MKINCIAVDDEPLALGLIRSFIQQTPFLNLIAYFTSSREVLNFLKDQQVDLIFMDIKMPNMNGIDLAKLLHQSMLQEYPRVIFTTAYNQFAIESYRVDALDYLLKPFGYDEFLRAANKALAFYESRIQKQQVPLDEYVFVRVGYQHIKIEWDEILYVEGLRDYVKIYRVGSTKPIIALNTLKFLEEKLPINKFMRIQRSFIIALNKIKAISKTTVWIGDTEIAIGDKYKTALQEVFRRRL